MCYLKGIVNGNMFSVIKKVKQYLIDIGLLKWISDENYIKSMYKKKMHENLNLSNPVTFNEKLQWLKLYNRKPEYTKMVDKYDVKKYVSNIIGEEYVIPTLGIWDKFSDIDFNKLPEKFVLKCTHDSGGLLICKDKSKLNLKKEKLRFDLIMKRNYYYRCREWPYKNVEPRIIAEPYLEDKEYGELRDYKFFVFSRKVKSMFIASNRQGKGDTYFDFFDENFNHLDVQNGHPNAPEIPQRPKQFEKMIELAKKIAKDEPQIRIDFYEVDGKIYFGEITFFHWSGMVAFEPSKWDRIFGDYIELPLNSNIEEEEIDE